MATAPVPPLISRELTKVGTVTPRAGAWVRGRLPVGIYPDGRRASIPLLVGRGRRAGPTLALITGSHGNEINGPEVVGRFLTTLSATSLHGTLLVLPIMNPWGFAARTREISIDGHDLNRSYPGHPHGSFTMQVADAIFTQIVGVVDAVIDVHDAGTKNVQLPHARVHLRPENDPTRALGLAFGSDIVIIRVAETGMLAAAAHRTMSAPVVTIEVGGAHQIWSSFQARTAHGLRNLLRKLGMLDGPLELPTVQRIVRKHAGIPAELSGIQTTFVQLGDFVAPGVPLYRIYDPLSGKEMTRRARSCGIVLGKNLVGHISRGQQAVDVLGYNACGEGAEPQGQLVHNRNSKNVLTFEPTMRWAHRQHRS